MSFQKIGILSIGEMGFHWAKLLKSRGVEVLTYDKDRGEVSQKRAQNAGVKSTASMGELVEQAELVVSIVVPSAATRVAAKVAEAVKAAGRKDLLFLDANAISPMAADEIAQTLMPAGVHFVDGGIIGSAARMGKGTIVYVSGPQADRLGLWSRSISRSRSWVRAPIRLRLSKSSTPGSPKGCKDCSASF